MLTAECPDVKHLDPRVRRTKKLLEEALRSLMNERPYGDISVGDVTARATVNRATFYAHFQDKQDLATALLRSDLKEAVLGRFTPDRPLNATTLTDMGEDLFEFMGRTLPAYPRHADELERTFAVTLQGTIEQILTVWISHDPAAMRAFPGVSKETVSMVLAWALFGGALRWGTQTQRPPARQAAQAVVSMLLR